MIAEMAVSEDMQRALRVCNQLFVLEVGG